MTLEQAKLAHAAWAAAFNAGDVAGMLAMYEAGAVVIPPGGPAAKGHGAIAEVLKAFMGFRGKMALTTVYCEATGDVALARAKWKLTGGKAPDGSPVELAGDAVEVHRRQADGKWLMVMDHAGGAG